MEVRSVAVSTLTRVKKKKGGNTKRGTQHDQTDERIGDDLFFFFLSSFVKKQKDKRVLCGDFSQY